MATYQDSRYNIALPSGSGGAITLIKTLTASSSATLSFVDGSDDVVLDNTYRTYIFKIINCHPSQQGGDGDEFTVGFRDGGSSYDATKTTTFFRAYHDEADSGTSLEYTTGGDLAQATGNQRISDDLGNGNDECCSGYLHLFNPSSTTFVKHFIARSNTYHSSDYSVDVYTAGYCNVTAAIDGVQFAMSSDEIQAGTIQMFGVL